MGCCPLRGNIYPLFPLVCLHTFIHLPFLNIPSYPLSSGPFYFLSAPLLSLLFRSVLSSILPPIPLFSLLFFISSVTFCFLLISFLTHFVFSCFVPSFPFCSLLSCQVCSVPFSPLFSAFFFRSVIIFCLLYPLFPSIHYCLVSF